MDLVVVVVVVVVIVRVLALVLVVLVMLLLLFCFNGVCQKPNYYIMLRTTLPYRRSFVKKKGVIVFLSRKQLISYNI